jgi:DNA polymerase-3 subunit alpha (Gram-positive type)
MRQILSISEKLSAKEQSTLKDMRVAQEMYARGYEFLPMDLQRVRAKDFIILDGKIMPALTSIQGLGEKAAQSIADAIKDGDILSVEMLKEKADIGQSVIALLDQFGLLDNLPRCSQLSLFD